MKTSSVLALIAILFTGLGSPRTVMAFNGPGGVNIHGFVSQGFLLSDEYNYLAHNSEDGSFEYSEIGINFAKDLTDKMRMGLQLFSRDIGDVANHKVTLDWAYGDYAFKNWLGLRFGRIKMPAGIYNETRDVDMLRTCIVLPQGIYNDLLRDNTIAINGASIYGSIGMGAAGDLGYQILAGDLTPDIESGVGKFTQSNYYRVGADSAQVTGGKSEGTDFSLVWDTPLSGLKLAYSRLDLLNELDSHLTTTINYIPPPYDMYVPVEINGHQETRTILQIASAEFTWNDLVVSAEYMHRETELEMHTLAGGTLIDLIRQNVKGESYYLMATYRFTDLFTLGAYYAEYYPDISDRDGEDLEAAGNPDHGAWEKDLALTLRFDLHPYWVLKLEGHSVSGTANVLFVDNADSDYDEEDWYYGVAKLTVSF